MKRHPGLGQHMGRTSQLATAIGVVNFIQTQRSWFSVREVSNALGIGERNTRRWLHAAEQVLKLEVERDPSLNGRGSVLYFRRPHHGL